MMASLLIPTTHTHTHKQQEKFYYLRVSKYYLYNRISEIAWSFSVLRFQDLIDLETSERDDIVIPENLNLLQKKTYGKTIIYFLKLS